MKIEEFKAKQAAMSDAELAELAEAVKAITTISKMYPKRDFQVRIEDNSIKMHWLDSQPTQVKAKQGHKIQRKLNQVREILGDKFIEFYWGGDRQMVHARF